jgi:hypothetical protein
MEQSTTRTTTGKGQAMGAFVRVIVTIFVFLAAYFFVFWVPLSFLPLGNHWWIASLIALAVAILAARYTWTKVGSTPGGMLSSAFTGGMIIGGIAFCGGFFGPILFAPDANQGPLLGLFVTGPLGFLAGLAVGAVYWFVKRRKGDTAVPIRTDL